MKFSIIIPCFNSEKYIIRCLENVSTIFGKKGQYIIVDDGSTDETKTLVHNYFNTYNSLDNIIIENELNKGVSYSRNVGLKNSTNEYIIFLDSDDTLELDFLERLDTVSDQFYESDLIRFNNNQSHFKFDSPQKICRFENIGDEFIKSYYLHSSCTQIIKRDLALQVKFNEKIIFGEDLLYSFELLNASKHTLFLSDSLYVYNLVEDSASNLVEPVHIKNKIKSIAVVYDLILLRVGANQRSLYRFKYLRELSQQLFKLYTIDKLSYQKELEEYEKFYKESYNLQGTDIFSIHAYLISKNMNRAATLLVKLYDLVKRKH